MRDAKRKFDDIKTALNITFCIFNCFAMFTGQQVCQLVIVAMHQFDEFHQNARPALRVSRSPLGLGCFRVGNCGVNLGLARQRDLALNFARHRQKDVTFAPAVAVNVLAVDIMSYLPHAYFLLVVPLYGPFILNFGHSIAGPAK